MRDPINLTDPTGMYATEKEALEVSEEKYNGAKVLQDYRGEWYIALDPDGVSPYKSGCELYRYYGKGRESSLDGLTLEEYATLSSALGVSAGVKQNLIEYAAKSNPKNMQVLQIKGSKNVKGARAVQRVLGKEVGSYFKFVKGVGVAGAVISATSTISDVIFNYDSEGKNTALYLKAGIDLSMIGIGFWGPTGFIVSSSYFLFDAAYEDEITKYLKEITTE